MNKVGKIEVIMRHPIKAMRGERLNSGQVDANGLYGDRSYYFLDESRNGEYLSADIVPKLLSYQAELLGEKGENSYPPVRITSPTGQIYDWADERFQSEIAAAAQRSITPKINTPEQGGANWEDHLLLVTDASLRRIANLWGKDWIDHRRFRGNLIIALDEDTPFSEDHWIGRQIKINDVLLQVNKHCERCMYINIDPTEISSDPSLLRTVAKERENHFGVYASVVQPGHVKDGDEVFVL